MDSGVTRVLVLTAFALTAASVILLSGGTPTVFLNGDRLGDLEIIDSSDGPQVALKQAARLFGARTDPGRDGGYVLEWGKTDSFYVDKRRLSTSGGKKFIDLDLLVENLDGRVSYRGNRANVRIKSAKLLSVSTRAGELSLNFDRYSSFSRSKKGNTLDLRFFNAVKTVGAGGINIQKVSSYLSEASVITSQNRQVILRLGLKQGVTTTVKTHRGESGFHFKLELQRPESGGSFTPAEDKFTKKQNFSYNQMQLWADGGRQTIHYLEISSWDQEYRLVPVLSGGKVGRGSQLTRLVQDNFGVAGLNANFFDPGTYTPIGLIIKDGDLLSRDWGSRAAVGIDYFGRLNFFRPDLDLFIRTSEENIQVQGLNRPAGKDDLVVYTPEYGKKISPGRSYVSLELRNGHVLSRSFTAPSSVEGNRRVVVATGNQRANLEGLREGDEAKFDWTMEPFIPMLRGAVSAGPLLIKNGRNVLDLEEENFSHNGGLVQSRASRSVLATTGEGELLFIVVAGAGLGLEALPGLLSKSGLGIENAIAFDGGSSAGMVYRDGVRIETVGGMRRIPVGLALIPR
ncbi:MAG: phosphodiester glycosidase family protein [Candidatus Bipolaricaulota bacterium]|nr:phosphodiester glycosidase family protein [Candidatus Bipolaricaulota bacterium]MBS3791954.1 phosphodiester glycosidase family protein [Candidatus Bipolaricaulota bacterium]